MARLQPQRLIWFLGAMCSLVSAASMCVSLLRDGLPFHTSLPLFLYFSFHAVSWLCLAHLLARGFALRLLPALAAFTAAMLVLYLWTLRMGVGDWPEISWAAGRVLFGLLLVLTPHQLPLFFRAYGMAPLLTVVVFLLAQWIDSPGVDDDPARAWIEMTSAALLTWMFLWSLRRSGRLAEESGA